MKRVYVAGSYNAPNIIDALKNIRRGIAKSVELLKLGYVPFCPWLDFQFEFYDDISIEEYKRYSMSWLEVCDFIYVMPNSEKSNGTQAEIKRAAELNIPIVYSVDELRRVNERNKDGKVDRKRI